MFSKDNNFIKNLFFHTSSNVFLSVFRQFIMLPILVAQDLLTIELAFTIFVIDIVITAFSPMPSDLFLKQKDNNQNKYLKRYSSDIVVFSFIASILISLFDKSDQNSFLAFIGLFIFIIISANNMFFYKLRIMQGKNYFSLVALLCRILGFSIFLIVLNYELFPNEYILLIFSLIIGEIVLIFILNEWFGKYLNIFASKKINYNFWLFSLLLLLNILFLRLELFYVDYTHNIFFKDLFILITLCNIFVLPINMLTSIPMAVSLSIAGEKKDKLGTEVRKFLILTLVLSIFLALLGSYLHPIFVDLLYPKINQYFLQFELILFLFFLSIYISMSRIILKISTISKQIFTYFPACFISIVIGIIFLELDLIEGIIFISFFKATFFSLIYVIEVKKLHKGILDE